jgi:hypothetical protein
MTERPGRIVTDLPVKLPRPRAQDLVYAPSFVGLAHCIRDSIREQKACTSTE